MYSGCKINELSIDPCVRNNVHVYDHENDNTKKTV